MNTRTQDLAKRVDNPFQLQDASATEAGSAMISGQAMAAVQGAVLMAKQFPRDQGQATNKIIDACTRTSLAREAEYAYPRGGTSVTGPSIRLAEVLAQNWGNIDFGIIELGQEGGRSQIMAYAWDLETNVRQQKVFVVEHKRKAHGKIKLLTDPRDVYELTANQGARRMRACILGILPRDVIEVAIEQIHLTLANTMEAPADEIAKLVEAFVKIGIPELAVKKRLGKNFKAITAAEVIRFRSIYRSIRDEMSAPADWFELDTGAEGNGNGASKTEALKTRIKGLHELLDSQGAVFDPEIHATDSEGGIIYNQDGAYRKRPVRKASAAEE